MKNKHYLLILLFLYPLSELAIIIDFVKESSFWSFLSYIGIIATTVFAYLFLLRNGTFIKTIFYKLTMFCWTIITIGVLFKIMHWPWALNILTVGVFGLILFYSTHFIKKNPKNRQDILRYVWVVTAFSCAWGIAMHYLTREFAFIPQVILLITITDFGYKCYNDKALLEK